MAGAPGRPMDIRVGDVLLLGSAEGPRCIFASAVQAVAEPAPGAGTWKFYVRGVVVLNFLQGAAPTPGAREPPDIAAPSGQVWKYVSYDVEYDPEPVYALSYMRTGRGADVAS